MRQRVPFSNGERVGLLAIVVGVLAIVIPIVYLGPGGFGIGPIGFAVLVMEVIVGIVGLATLSVGVYSFRTGDLRPAIAAVTMICSLTIVGGIGAYIEMTGGPLVPIWVWLIAGLFAIGASLWLTDQFVPREQTRSC